MIHKLDEIITFIEIILFIILSFSHHYCLEKKEKVIK